MYGMRILISYFVWLIVMILILYQVFTINTLLTTVVIIGISVIYDQNNIDDIYELVVNYNGNNICLCLLWNINKITLLVN